MASQKHNEKQNSPESNETTKTFIGSILNSLMVIMRLIGAAAGAIDSGDTDRAKSALHEAHEETYKSYRRTKREVERRDGRKKR